MNPMSGARSKAGDRDLVVRDDVGVVVGLPCVDVNVLGLTGFAFNRGLHCCCCKTPRGSFVDRRSFQSVL